jgi:hypothetical protein
MIFQYQGKVEPLLPLGGAPADSPPLAWLAVFPDLIPHRRSQLAPSVCSTPLPASLTEIRVSQIPLETLFAYTAPLTRVSQAPVELLIQYALALRQVRVGQAAVEIVYPYGCYIFVPPLPASCPVTLPPDPNTAPCADAAPTFP